jgi:hypothetical protein
VKLFAVCILPLALGSLAGQDRPQLTWQGEVQGGATLSIRGKHVELENSAHAKAPPQRFHFIHPLPDSTLDVRLEKIEGRGDVHIVEQPRIDNGYTLAVRIEDRQAGSSSYSLAFYWDASSSRLENPHIFKGGGRLTWKGRVDDEVIVTCHQSTCQSNATSGQPVLREEFRFSRPLPESEVELNLEDTEGRGEIRLLESPLEKNGYTARVLIRDPQAGMSDYGFTLTWTRPLPKESAQASAQLGLIWKARVDGLVRVVIRGGAAVSQVLEGKPVTAESTDFYRQLPAESTLNPALKKLSGPGRVQIVELPSSQNHFELAFEIDGRDGGAGDYQVEVDW